MIIFQNNEPVNEQYILFSRPFYSGRFSLFPDKHSRFKLPKKKRNIQIFSITFLNEQKQMNGICFLNLSNYFESLIIIKRNHFNIFYFYRQNNNTIVRQWIRSKIVKCNLQVA